MTATVATEAAVAPRKPNRGPIGFVALAYLLAWAWSVPLAVADLTVEQGRGWPTHVPALVAPLVAALVMVAVSGGRNGLAALGQRLTRWRFAPRWWLVALSPLLALATVLAVMGLAGQDLPQWADFASFNGLPDHGVFATLVLVLLLNGFGEEAGWRGYLLDRLQRRFDPLPATLIVSLVWAVWHAPFFFILSTYAGFNAMTLVMFPLGLTSGAIVLTWLYNHTGGSILAVAVWHTLYNMAVATGGATDLIQGIVTAMIMVAAAALVVGEVFARRRGRSVLGVEPRL